nr:hypothetical protein GCM10020241_59380 [Streptoalloteichus tenebrarius]
MSLSGHGGALSRQAPPSSVDQKRPGTPGPLSAAKAAEPEATTEPPTTTGTATSGTGLHRV